MLLAGRLDSHREEHLLGMLTVLLLRSCWDAAKLWAGSINPSVADRVRDVLRNVLWSLNCSGLLKKRLWWRRPLSAHAEMVL